MALLYGARGSVGSAAVEAALTWTGLPFEVIDAPPWDGGPEVEALRALNPLAQVPTVVMDDGTVLTESAAILVHLGLAFPSSGLLPEEAAARARQLRGLVYLVANCYPDITLIDFPERYLEDCSEGDAGRLRRATRAHLHRLWTHFADACEGAPFLAGGEPGALDLLAAAVSRCFGTRAHLRATRPALADLLERVDMHPRVAPVFERHWPRTPAV